MHLIKFGGSVITHKGRELTLRRKVLQRLCRELRAAKGEMVLVHGAGSFGHTKAKRYGLKKGIKKGYSPIRAAQVQWDVRDLDQEVLKAGLDVGLPFTSIPPYPILRMHNRKVKVFDPKPFEIALKEGLVPVTFGDVVLDGKQRVAICSGDDLMVHLAKYFRPERAIFVTVEDGVYDRPPSEKGAQFIEVLSPKKKVRSGSSGVADVTGDIGKKVDSMREMSRFGVETLVINGLESGRLRRVLQGKETLCTRMPAEGK